MLASMAEREQLRQFIGKITKNWGLSKEETIEKFPPFC